MSKGNETSRTLEMPLVVREATLSSFDEKSRTAEFVFSTGARVMRSDFWTGERWIEEVSMDPSHANLKRVDQGSVPFLKNHGSWSGAGIEDVLGRVTEASVDGKQGIGKVMFSERDDVQPFIRDIQAGILKSVSMGYAIRKMQKVGEEDGVPILRAVDWELFEISSVAMPADAAAQFRDAKDGKREGKPPLFRCEVRGLEVTEKTEVDAAQSLNQTESNQSQIRNTGENTMSDVEKEAAVKAAAESAKKEGIKAERERQAEIRKMVRAAKLDEAFGEKLIEGEVALDAARASVIEELAKADTKTETRSIRVEAGEQDEVGTRREAMKEAILHRGNPEIYKSTERAREWSGLSLLEMARESLRRSGVKVGGMSRTEIATRAMHTTSDFTEITADIINKSLRDAFQAAPQTFAPFTRRVQNPDFKQISRVQLGMGSSLVEVPEGGEVTYGSVGEAAEKYSIKEYAKGLSLSRKTIINDDLNAFVRLPAAMGQKARSLESDVVYDILRANALMADGIALFASGHGNLAGAGGAISLTTLAAARAAMRAQKEMDGEPLNLAMRWLLVPVTLETVAEQFVTAVQPNDQAKVNPFAPGGRTPLQIIVEPRLGASYSGGSDISWFAASELAAVDMIELATLSGTTEPEVVMEEGFDVLGMKFRVVHSVGAKAIDWRGLYKNPGA